jgi:CxxC-x17-CxxC domain-containing protein
MFEAKCTNCGKTCSVPFKPTAGKPVYCRDCFSKRNQTPQNTTKTPANFDGKQAWARRRNNNPDTKSQRDEGFAFMYAP